MNTFNHIDMTKELEMVRRGDKNQQLDEAPRLSTAKFAAGRQTILDKNDARRLTMNLGKSILENDDLWEDIGGSSIWHALNKQGKTNKHGKTAAVEQAEQHMKEEVMTAMVNAASLVLKLYVK